MAPRIFSPLHKRMQPSLPAGVSHRAQARTRGFTLIEIMCAGAIFMLGFAGILQMDIAASNHLQHAKHLEQATVIANSLAGVCNLLPDNQLASMGGGLTTSYDLGGALNGAPTYYTAVTTATPKSGASPPMYYVRVVVSWSEAYLKMTEQVTVQTTVSTGY